MKYVLAIILIVLFCCILLYFIGRMGTDKTLVNRLNSIIKDKLFYREIGDPQGRYSTIKLIALKNHDAKEAVEVEREIPVVYFDYEYEDNTYNVIIKSTDDNQPIYTVSPV